jgi:U4/U6 small nuclear ribonucleoprotein PRP31
MATPNLSALLSPEVAKELVRLAGGVGALVQLPSVALRHFGEKTGSADYDPNQKYHAGVLLACPLVQAVSRDNKHKAVAKLANKAHLAAVVDASGSTPDGTYGATLRNELAMAFEALDAPPPGREDKPLPIPKDPEPKKRAGAKLQRINAAHKETVLERKAQVQKFGDFRDIEKQQQDLMHSRDVLSAQYAAKQAEAAKELRIAANGGRPNTKTTSAAGIGSKRGRGGDDDLLDLAW